LKAPRERGAALTEPRLGERAAVGRGGRAEEEEEEE